MFLIIFRQIAIQNFHIKTGGLLGRRFLLHRVLFYKKNIILQEVIYFFLIFMQNFYSSGFVFGYIFIGLKWCSIQIIWCCLVNVIIQPVRIKIIRMRAPHQCRFVLWIIMWIIVLWKCNLQSFSLITLILSI